MEKRTCSPSLSFEAKDKNKVGPYGAQTFGSLIADYEN